MSGMQSSLLVCLTSMSDPGLSPAVKAASVVVCDMSAVIHMVKPNRAQMFGEYTHRLESSTQSAPSLLVFRRLLKCELFHRCYDLC